jgi:flavin-dependent dehydrogenase
MDWGDGPLAEPIGSGDDVDATYAPRRFVLDSLLAEAAVAAGAELRERFSVQELLWDDGRVVGIRGRGPDGGVVDEHARIVVGADGMRSLVARAAGTAKYHERPILNFGYFSYFSGVPMAGVVAWIRPGCGNINFPTNDDLTCVVLQAAAAGFHEFRADIEGNFFRALDRVPEWAARVRAGRREERWYGTADLPNFFRKPFGPGWALVGDAGYVKDPALAQGISDAFRDAALLSEAIDAGFSERAPLDEALAAYARERDAAVLPGYEANYAVATFAPPPPELLERRAAQRRATRERTDMTAP